MSGKLLSYDEWVKEIFETTDDGWVLIKKSDNSNVISFYSNEDDLKKIYQKYLYFNL